MPQLAVEFFAKFMRLEYALKAHDRYRQTRNGTVKPDWDGFAHKQHIAALFPELQNDPAARYLIELPPRMRILRAGTLAWSDQPNACENMADVCAMLRRIRHNLFHGDKGLVGSEQDERLLIAGLVVMDALIEADVDIQGWYVAAA
jgi:hypothetical protein